MRLWFTVLLLCLSCHAKADCQPGKTAIPILVANGFTPVAEFDKGQEHHQLWAGPLGWIDLIKFGDDLCTSNSGGRFYLYRRERT